MAVQHGKGTQVFLNQFNVTPYCTAASASYQQQLVNVTTFGNNSEVRLPGLRQGNLSIQGLFDGGDDLQDEIFSGLSLTTAPLVTVFQSSAAPTFGDRAQVFQGWQGNYGARSPVADAVRFSNGFESTGNVYPGAVCHTHTQRTTTGNFTSFDHGALTSNGAIANLHVTQFSGTTVTIKVQHSTDNSVWVDLITFNAVTGLGSQRGSSTGTVNRWLRAAITAGTFTSVTFAIGTARLT